MLLEVPKLFFWFLIQSNINQKIVEHGRKFNCFETNSSFKIKETLLRVQLHIDDYYP